MGIHNEDGVGWLSGQTHTSKETDEQGNGREGFLTGYEGVDQ